MKHHLPGLNTASQNADERLEGLFLVRVERATHRWHPQKPFLALRLVTLEPKEHVGKPISGRLYCTPKALWKLNWFLRDFGYDPDLLGREDVDERALRGFGELCGCRTPRSTGGAISTSRVSPRPASGKS